jgi:Tfp pilus assembly protein PilF
MAGAAEPIVASGEPQPGREEATVTAAASMENEGPPEPEPPPQRPAVFRPLSAESLTERGISLLDQGRIQEAIDQFTKAIALDSGYRPAWSRRAEAYDKIGRNQEAAEDLRRLEAI